MEIDTKLKIIIGIEISILVLIITIYIYKLNIHNKDLTFSSIVNIFWAMHIYYN